LNVYARIIHFADAVGRHRALTEEESIWLEEAIRLDAHRKRVSRNESGCIRPWAVANIRGARADIRWTKADIRKLKRHLAEGRSVPEIAPILGRTAPAVHRKMRKEGLRCRQSSVALDQAAE
jgi:hypothetical protein